MTDRDKNKKIAEWLGWRPDRTEPDIFLTKDKKFVLITDIADYLNTNASFDLLDVLVERGYWWELQSYSDTGEALCRVGEFKCLVPLVNHREKSKPRAICEAVLALIEKEKEK